MASRGMRAAALTLLAQEVLAGAVNPEQSEQTGEVENALPAVPVQEERACTADHQRPARETTLVSGSGKGHQWGMLPGVDAAGHCMHFKRAVGRGVCRHCPPAPSPRDSATCPVPHGILSWGGEIAKGPRARPPHPETCSAGREKEAAGVQKGSRGTYKSAKEMSTWEN